MHRILHFFGFNGYNNESKYINDNVKNEINDKVKNEINDKVNNLVQLKKFIILGMESSDNNMLLDNLTILDELLYDYKYDDILEIIIDFKNYPSYHLLYVLATCCSIRLHNDILDYGKDFRDDCFKLVLDICKTSFDLFNFVELYESINKQKYNSTGWNSSMKKMISKWYNTKNPRDIIHDIKIHDKLNQKRNSKWNHKDIITLAHVKARNEDINILLKYLVKGYNALDKQELYILEHHFK
jgi:hypothetical protein